MTTLSAISPFTRMLRDLVMRAHKRDKKVGAGDWMGFGLTVARIAYRAGYAARKDDHAREQLKAILRST